jgi:hypothetical protein
MYTLYNTSVELDAGLATAPQPVFHYNTPLASLAIDHFFSEDYTKLQTLQLDSNSLDTTTDSNSPSPKYMTSGWTEEKTPSQRKHPSVVT